MTAVTSYKTIFGFLERRLHCFYTAFFYYFKLNYAFVISFSFPIWWKFIFLLLSSKECTTVAKCARCPDKISCRRCKPRYYKLRTSSSANSTCVSSCPLGFFKKGRRCQRLAEGKKKQKGGDDENRQWNQSTLFKLREHTLVLLGLPRVRDFFFTQHFAIPTIGTCFDNLSRSYRQGKDDLRLKWPPSTTTTQYSFRTIDFTGSWAGININTSPFKCHKSMNPVFLIQESCIFCPAPNHWVTPSPY